MKKITLSVDAILNRIYAASALNTFVNIDSATCHATLSPANDAPLRVLIPDVLTAVLGSGLISAPSGDHDTLTVFVAGESDKITPYLIEAAVANRMIADMLVTTDDASATRYDAYAKALENRIAEIFSDDGVESAPEITPTYY